MGRLPSPPRALRNGLAGLPPRPSVRPSRLSPRTAPCGPSITALAPPPFLPGPRPPSQASHLAPPPFSPDGALRAKHHGPRSPPFLPGPRPVGQASRPSLPRLSHRTAPCGPSITALAPPAFSPDGALWAKHHAPRSPAFLTERRPVGQASRPSLPPLSHRTAPSEPSITALAPPPFSPDGALWAKHHAPRSPGFLTERRPVGQASRPSLPRLSPKGGRAAGTGEGGSASESRTCIDPFRGRRTLRPV